MENLAPDLFTKSVKGHEILHHFFYSFEGSFSLDGRGVSDISCVMQTFGARNMLFYVQLLFIYIAILSLYVAFNLFHHPYHEDVGLWARDSLKFPALTSFWNAPTNIS